MHVGLANIRGGTARRSTHSNQHTHTLKTIDKINRCAQSKRETHVWAQDEGVRMYVMVCVCVFALWQHIIKQQQQQNNAGQILSASDGNSIL